MSSGQSSQEYCLAQKFRKDPFRDPGPPSGHTLFLFQRALRTHKSDTLLALPRLFVTYIWMGRRLIEDVVVHKAPLAQNPGTGEGWRQGHKLNV